MAYLAKAIANKFLNLGDRDGFDITPMHIIKFVYFAHGWNLAIYEKPLIKEPFYAWVFGPVEKGLYQEFCNYGTFKIQKQAVYNGIDLEKDELPTEYLTLRVETPRDERSNKVIEEVWDVYGKNKFSAMRLSNMTHAEGSPWDRLYEKNKNILIPNEEIKNYFSKFKK